MRDARTIFNDGTLYEQSMGVWSRLIGVDFLDWLGLPRHQRWLDVGCGTGVFTDLIVDRCSPAEIHGIDLAPDQIAYARARPAARVAEFREGDAMALPYADGRFDAAVMALVIAFVPDAARAVAEMVRVVRPGGTVAAYTWDRTEGGLPHAPLLAALNAAGHSVPLPPNRMADIDRLWAAAGLEDIGTRQIAVEKVFDDFDSYWRSASTVAVAIPVLAALPEADLPRVKAETRARLSADASGRIIHTARANAIKGRRPL